MARSALYLLASVLFLCSTPPAAHAQAPSSGLIGWWKLDANADDSSPQGRHGVVKNATPIPDRLDNAMGAYHFDGKSYITIPGTTDQNLLAGFSIAVWVRLTGDNHDQAIFSKHHWGYSNGLLLGVGDIANVADNSFSLYAGGELPRVVSPTSALDRQWHHVVGTYDGASARLYVDGSLVASGLARYTKVNNEPFRIGASSNIESGFIGDVDDVRLYDRPLDMNEIRVLERTITIPAHVSPASAHEYIACNYYDYYHLPATDGQGNDYGCRTNLLKQGAEIRGEYMILSRPIEIWNFQMNVASSDGDLHALDRILAPRHISINPSCKTEPEFRVGLLESDYSRELIALAIVRGRARLKHSVARGRTVPNQYYCMEEAMTELMGRLIEKQAPARLGLLADNLERVSRGEVARIEGTYGRQKMFDYLLPAAVGALSDLAWAEPSTSPESARGSAKDLVLDFGVGVALAELAGNEIEHEVQAIAKELGEISPIPSSLAPTYYECILIQGASSANR